MTLDRSPEEHLQPTELAELIEAKGSAAEESLGPTAPGSPLGSILPGWGKDLHPHLAKCSLCLERLQHMAGMDRQLESLKNAIPIPPSPGCPEPTVWREIAVALTPSDQALVHLQHASACDHCGPLLREAIVDLDGEITDSEAKKITALESARPEWQRRLATRITGKKDAAPHAWWKPWATAPRLGFASLGLVALIAAGSWFAARKGQPAPPTDLLASAYSDQRPFEMRIPGASYGPVRIQRGAEGSFTSHPADLLKAEAIIAAEIGSHASDPNWLQAKARADLLEGKYDSAVETLRHALQIEPKSSSLLIDLGTAYFQRALMAERQEDLGAAYESLSHALATQPDNPVALFNRAIVAEHQFLFHQAIADWDHYLRVDSASDWASEARQHADAVRAKLKEHDQSHAAPLLSPSLIVAQAGNPNLRAQVDQRVEEYLHEAVVSWLPHGFPDGKEVPDPSAVQALFFLADVTAQQHGDRWLTDLLANSSSTDFPRAVAALASAVKASDRSDYDSSAKQADAAQRFFTAAGDVPGVLYAEFEQGFSAQMRRHSESCPDRSAAATESQKYPYWWLQAQLGLEQAFCAGITGNLGFDEQLARQSLEDAKRAGYGALFLRTLVFVAQDKFEAGDHDAAWKLLMTGLSSYWSAQLPTVRVYNLYGFASEMAEASALANFELALWNEALSAIASDPSSLLKAGAHGEAARAASAAGHPELAQHHYAEATQLYSQVPQSDAVRSFELSAQIQAAHLDNRLGHPEAAMVRLNAIRGDVSNLRESYLVQAFYSTLGQVELSQQRYPEAEQALNPALALAEQNLSSLRSEEQRVRWSKDAAPIYLGLAESKLAQGQIQDSLAMLEIYLGAGRLSVDTNNSPAGGRSNSSSLLVSAHLPLLLHETVLAYGLLPDGLAIWSYDNRGVNARWIRGKNEQILELAGRLNDLASDPRSDSRALRRDAHSLYDLLIAPIEPQLEAGRTIIIEADGALSRIPFEILVDSNDHYLLERGAIAHSLGMYADERLRSEDPISADSSVLVVSSQSGSQINGIAPLTNTDAEADAVASHFHDARVLRSPGATLAQVGAGMRSVRTFHFVGHALANSKESGLLLDDRDPQTGRPRLFQADTVRHIRTRDLQLAVLSACGTANAKTEDATGFSSVNEAFLRAGVPHVVASRWAVDSTQTGTFVEDFYQKLLAGTPVSEATRAAARKMLANPRTSHPYYWAAFAAYGRP